MTAVTSQFEEPLYPVEVLVPAGEAGLESASVVLLNQIRSIDKRRLTRRLGKLRPETMIAVDRAICISMGLFDLA